MADPTRPLPVLLRLGRELLGLLDALQRAGLVTGGLRADDLWLDGTGSWTLMETARIREPTGPESFREDLRLWASLCRSILARCGPAEDEAASWLADRVRRADGGASSAADLRRGRAPGRSRISPRAADGWWTRLWKERPPSRRERRGPEEGE